MQAQKNRRKSALIQASGVAPIDITKLYEDAMKIATENKINTNNSWQLPLIDYFHDLDVLKEGDSINFQKASCTLDGCVKIYTSRVDSVDSETKKLMSGLVNSQDFEDDDVAGEVSREKKTRKRHANVTETNPENLNVKKFDSEFMVDPLFKKTSADFDEGGAGGLLLSHLSLGINGGIIFDASNAESLHTIVQIDENPMLNETVDISVLRKNFADSMASLADTFVCPSLRDFQFSSENSNFDPQKYLEQAQDFLNVPDQPDFMANDDGYNDIDDGGFGGFDDAGGAADVSIMPLQYQVPVKDDAIPGMLQEMRHSRLSLGAVPDEALLVETNDLAENELFSYFDRATMKNWMGPEMWKAKRAAAKKEALADADGSNFPEPKKRQKTVLSFTEEIDENELFAKPKTLSLLDLAKTQQAKKEDHLLPQDLMLGSKDFLSLFTKPGFVMRVRKTHVAVPQFDEEGDGPIEGDALFWAENEIQPETDPMAGGGFGNGDLMDNMPDSDAESEAEQPLGLPLTQTEGDWGSQLLAEPKKVKTQFVNYARVAKKVDVKLLKENLWKNLSQKTKQASSNGKVEFKQVMTGLKPEYPEKKWNDISVAFCFICLLHLANENELEILPGTVKTSDTDVLQNGVNTDLLIRN